jgi:hypothetical protein
MILFAQNENKIVDKYKKLKEENLNDKWTMVSIFVEHIS